MVFGAYALYYDLLYADKEYAAEADYVAQLLQEHGVPGRRLLELGSGTGAHAALLTEKGYDLVGVDLSVSMLERAERRRCELSRQAADRLRFTQGDARSIRLQSCFDAVLSLFHVVSYQAHNEDLRAVFATAAEHLEPGGLFLFDAWYGPAVLTERPSVRVKRLEDTEFAVTRIAEPELIPNRNWVDVHYTVFVREKATGITEVIQEQHRMRYLFQPEVEELCAGAGLTLVDSLGWLTHQQPGFDTWGACWVARKEGRPVKGHG